MIVDLFDPETNITYTVDINEKEMHISTNTDSNIR